MGVSCQIFINNPREGVYRAGKSINGVVKYAIDVPTEYENIELSLVGKGKVHWTESDTDSDGRSTSRSYSSKEQYVKQGIKILDHETTTIPFGAYEIPFQFQLPYNIPSSQKVVQKGVTCNIIYKVVIIFQKPALLGLDKRFSKELIVYGNVSPPIPDVPIIYGIEKSLFSLFSSNPNKVILKCEVPKSMYAPGDNTCVTCTVTNDSEKNILAVKSEIVAITVYSDSSGSKNTVEKKYNDWSKSPEIKQQSVETFNLRNSISPEQYSIQHSKIVKRNYYIRITLELPMPHINKSLDIPIVVGDTDVHEVDTLDEDASPPSYWEAMMEDKLEANGKEVFV